MRMPTWIRKSYRRILSSLLSIVQPALSASFSTIRLSDVATVINACHFLLLDMEAFWFHLQNECGYTMLSYLATPWYRIPPILSWMADTTGSKLSLSLALTFDELPLSMNGDFRCFSFLHHPHSFPTGSQPKSFVFTTFVNGKYFLCYNVSTFPQDLMDASSSVHDSYLNILIRKNAWLGPDSAGTWFTWTNQPELCLRLIYLKPCSWAKRFFNLVSMVPAGLHLRMIVPGAKLSYAKTQSDRMKVSNEDG